MIIILYLSIYLYILNNYTNNIQLRGLFMNMRYRPITIILFLCLAGAIAFFANDYTEKEINSGEEQTEYPKPFLDDSEPIILEENNSESSSGESNPVSLPISTPSPTPELTPTSSPAPETTPLTFYYSGLGSGGSGSKGNSGGSSDEQKVNSGEENTEDSTEEPSADPTEEPEQKPTTEPAVEPTDDPENTEEIPEFPTVIFPVILIIGLFLILRRS